MEIIVKAFESATVLDVQAPRIDAAVAIQFKDKVREAVSEGTGRVILDLSQVEFLDSSGLGAVVAAMKQLGKERPLELAALSPKVDKVMKLTCMDRVFTIHETVAAALAPENVA